MLSESLLNKNVVVTTDYRGVFFGRLNKIAGPDIELRFAQNCVYYSEQCHGVFGLAANGPTEDCRIGPPVKRLVLRNVTSICEVTPAAARRWKAQPWSNS